MSSFEENSHRQLNLFSENLQADDLYSTDKYIITEKNKLMVDYLLNIHENWKSDKFTLLYGEKYSGKSHLAYISAQKNNGIIVNRYSYDKLYNENFLQKSDYFIIDGIGNFEETMIFHAFNYLRLHKKYALFTTNKKISQIELPDLRSRLSSIPTLEINFLNKDLAYGIFIKIFSDYDISINSKIIEYIVNNFELSFENIKKFSDRIRNIHLTKKEKLSLNKIKKVFGF